MGENNKATGMVAYLEGQPVGEIPEPLPELALAPDAAAEVSPLQAALSSLSTTEIRIDPEAAARLVSSVEDCVLFMWATYPMMAEALEVIKAWGFTYKSIAFQWVKLNRSGKGYFFGLGRWTRGNTEPCLIATRGKPKRISAAVSQSIFSPIRSHSQKPEEVREKIVELMGDLPRVELFARERADGWDAWGNEAPPDEKEIET